MAQNFYVDPLDTECQEGRHLAIGLMHDQILAEARKAAEDGKRALSGGDSPRRSTKRSCHGRGKARGRRGGRAGRRSGLTTGMGTEVLALPAEDSLPSPRAQLNAQEIFEQNMERLSAILESCPYPAEPERSSASSWSVRQQKASDRWEEARPYHLRCLLESEAVGKPLCCFCHQPAVIRCRECLPEEWFCGACDVHYHSKRPLHNRDSVVDGFLKAIAPSTCISRGEDGQCYTHEQVRILPTVRVQHCTCSVPNFTLSAGKPAILITINGRYDLHLPLYVCQTCSQQWSPDVKDLVRSGYWPASASAATMYTVDLLNSFQELKVISPGFSRQAFAKLLEHRTQCAGRSGQINGDALQRSFLEFAYASFEKDQLCCDTPFTCPACTPEMVVVAADGNRKLYRFGHTGRSNDTPFFDGLFLAKDSEVSAFVNTIQMAVKNIQGRGTCGDSQWAAARETSRRATKLDEEGVEVAVCRHGYLLKALNMYRGEIFAYPLYLQKELLPKKAQFFAMDVACKYWPYLQKVAAVIPALKGLTEMKPFLSIMHARAHATKCEIKWSGRNQEGAGTTAGEEVEQVNSYLSRCALTTKYMSKAARVDMLTMHAMGWNRHKDETLHKALSTRYWKTSKRAKEEAERLSELKRELECSDAMAVQWIAEVKEWAESETQVTGLHDLQQSIEGLHLGVKQQKQTLYRQNDSNKLRHRLRRKLTADKKRLFQEIEKYNSLVADNSKRIEVARVDQSLAGQSTDTIWPWEDHGSVRIGIKKTLHDQYMLKTRLQEELPILVLEMAQHCTWLQNLAVVLKIELARCEDGNGLHCLLTRRLAEVTERLKMVLQQYKTALGPQASVLLDVPQEEECDDMGLSSPDTSEDEEEAREDST